MINHYWVYIKTHLSELSVLNDNLVNIWLMSILASTLICLTGIFPLLIIPFANDNTLLINTSDKILRRILSFAVGGLLGDVFLHILPEAWDQKNSQISPHAAHIVIGAWIICGIITFLSIEIIFSNTKTEDKHIVQNNGQLSHDSLNAKERNKKIDISGYLNLFANGIDNFSHGLAVAGSFIAGTKIGLLTTFAIIIHEIPHEIGDFAILIKSGFSKWDAAKAQLLTASIGILGAIAALFADYYGKVCIETNWLLPFTSGGFINIALVSIVPDLLKEEDPWESIIQTIFIGIGIAMMLLVKLII